MKISLKPSLQSLTATIGVLLMTIVYPTSVYGLSTIQAGANAAQGSGQPSSLFGGTGIFTTITNTMLFIIGALSVIMLIFGGLRYVVSGGNATAITAAKNTILYAIVGLVVALLAYAVINFVLTTLVPGAGGGGTNI